MEERYPSSATSSAERAVERERAWEKAYRAKRVERGSGGAEGSEAGEGGESSLRSGWVPRIMRSPWRRVVLKEGRRADVSALRVRLTETQLSGVHDEFEFFGFCDLRFRFK